VTYGSLPQVNNVLYVLKPAVLGIIVAGILKLGRAAIRNTFLAVLLIAAFVGMKFGGVNFLLIMLLAGLINLFIEEGWPARWRDKSKLPVVISTAILSLPFIDSRWFQMSWLFLKTGLFSFGGAYASIVFLEKGAVQEHHWLTSSQLLDGVALSVATPGPFMLFTTFVGYLVGGTWGAILATFLVFLPSFIFILWGARYIERVRDNSFIQAFLAGASAAVVGLIVVVSLDLMPAALVDLPAVVIAAASFAAIVFLKVDVAKVALSAMAGGVLYAIAKAA
jgi:chromate transporter